MKTKFALLVIFLYSFFGASAQQPVIQNAGFETWNDSVPSYPVGWDSDGHLIHKQSALLRQKGWCVQDTTPANVVAGSASCRLRTDTVGVINTIIPGVVSYGSLGFNGTPYPIGVPFTGRPTVFSGSVKFIPNGADTAQFNLFLSKWDATGDSEIIIVLDNEIVLGTDSSFVTFSDTLHYLNSFTPDTIIIAFSSGLLNDNPIAGSILWVDNLALEYATTGIQHLDVEDAIKLYPNPAANALTISVDNYMAGYGFKIYDLTGKLVKAATIETASYNLNISDLAEGAYLYSVENMAGKVIHQSKFNVIR